MTAMMLPREVAVAVAARAEVLGSEFGTTADTPREVRVDAVSIFFLCVCAVWTLMLAGGMIFLHTKRHLPTVRIRGLPLTFAGIVLLHMYWMTIQTGYTFGPLAPEVAEFWIMSIWYPFGVALFQAGNSQFLHVAKAQSRFARPPSQMTTRYDEKRGFAVDNSWLGRLRRMDYSQRMFLFVTVGMACQLVVVVVIFLISRKFHPAFGIPGTEIYGDTWQEIAAKQGRGWEWWPSVFWQFLWAWVIAPVILWRSRGIKDTHGWQLQTMACCIAGLHAAPMWLIALYVPGMQPVNQYWVPPQWIGLSIWIMEFFTVFVPCWHIRKHQNLKQETLDSIASWERKKKLNRAQNDNSSGRSSNRSGPLPPLSPTSTKVGETITSEMQSAWKNKFGGNDETGDLEKLPDESVMTMAALEHVLDKNPEPLRQFSARRDFSGENIAFLTAVAEWKQSLPPAFIRNRHNTAPELVRLQFTRALRIYTEFVSPRDAEFPINIDWHELRKLEGIFERAARSLYPKGVSKASGNGVPSEWRLAQESRGGSEINMVTSPSNVSIPHHHHSTDAGLTTSAETLALDDAPTNVSDSQLFRGDIPTAFDASVFDAAHGSIKYLVLTNTWPKYVREKRSSDSLSRESRAADTYDSKESKGSLSKALAFLKPMVR